jgi:hypothetical protein
VVNLNQCQLARNLQFLNGNESFRFIQ